MKKVTTIVNFILDRSGSMESIQEATIKGFNKYLSGLKEIKNGEVLFSLTMFDTSVERICTNLLIKEVKKLNKDNYQPDGGTALYDAAVSTIEASSDTIDRMESKPSVITVIMTDGEENSSKEHDEDCLKDLIHKLQHEGNWTFVFLGANQDSYATGKKLGTFSGNTQNFLATSSGIDNSFRSITNSTLNLVAFSGSKGSAMGVTNFADMANGKTPKLNKGGGK